MEVQNTTEPHRGQEFQGEVAQLPERSTKQASTRATPSYHVETSTDSEWAPEGWVSTQFETSYACAVYRDIFIRSDITDDEKARCTVQGFNSGTHVTFITRTDATNLLALHYERVGIKNKCTGTLQMFYSPKDLEFALGWDFLKPLYIAGTKPDRKYSQRPKLTQKRNIKGRFTVGTVTLTVHDLKGWAPGSLKSLAASVGYTFESKDTLENFKTKMFDALKEHPELFIKYAMGDVAALPEIKRLYIASMNKVRALVGLPAKESFPHTTGSLVARTLEEWFIAQSSTPTLFKYCMRCPLGITQEANNVFKHFFAATHDDIKARCAAIDNDPYTKDKPIKELLDATMIQDALSGASVKYFGGVKGETAVFNAITQGGRCVNERPTEYRLEIGADIDLQSCYGSALRNLIYPIGLPRVLSFTSHQPRITLGDFISKHGDQLVEGLWTVTVSSKKPLSFEQDLIFSKLVTASTINDAINDKQYIDRDVDDSTISGSFTLLRREIVNGIITSHVLEVLQKVCTNQEFKEIKDLEVVSAAFYAKEDRIDTIDNLCTHVLKSDGWRYKNDKGYGDMIDERTRAWVAIPLEKFIGVLVDARTPLKARKKDKSLTDDERTKAKAEDEALKLFINTTYGTIASQYFSTSNTVLSNNITAKARVGAWLISKALHTRQTITDGGFYGLNEVPFLTGDKKPGMGSLSNQLKTKCELRPLGGIDWTRELELSKTGMTQNVKNLDALATEHIAKFWERYKITLPFKIEHKLEHTFTVAAYLNKSDYLLKTFDGQEVFKIRGTHEFEEEEDNKTSSPKYEILRNIVAGNDTHPDKLQYDHVALLKVSAWSKSQQTATPSQERPGDEIRQKRTLRLNNSYTAIDTAKELRQRVKRATKPGILFERFASEGIASVLDRLNRDDLKD